MSAVTELNKVRMSQKQIIEALRKEASTNKCFNDVAHVFATRERARQQVTIAALRLRMEEEGFDYARSEYVKVLKFLASLHLGVLDTDEKGNVISLKSIKTTLQSIGAAAVQMTTNKLVDFTPAVHFKTLTSTETEESALQPPTVPSAQTPASHHPIPATPKYAVELTAYIEGKPITFRVPRSMSTDELGEILAGFSLKRGEA